MARRKIKGLVGVALLLGSLAVEKVLTQEPNKVDINDMSKPSVASKVGDISLEQRVLNPEFEHYHYLAQTFNNKDDLFPLKKELWTNVEAVRWLFDIPNGMKNGSLLEIIEAKTPDGVSYPQAFAVNNTWYAGLLKEDPKSNKVTIDYFDINGYSKATLWLNKKENTRFDVDQKFMRLPLAGNPEDIVLTDKFGKRPKRIEYYGGPDQEFHYGIDLRASVNTSLFASVDGSITIGYTPSSGKFAALRMQRKFWDSGYGTRLRTYILSYFHMNGYPQNIIDALNDHSDTSEWFNRMINKDAEQILLYLLETDQKRIISQTSVPIIQGQILGESGATGKATDAHLHYQIGLVTQQNSADVYVLKKPLTLTSMDDDENNDGSQLILYADPEKFMDMYLMKQIHTPSSMRPVFERLDTIIYNQKNKKIFQ